MGKMQVSVNEPAGHWRCENILSPPMHHRKGQQRRCKRGMSQLLAEFTTQQGWNHIKPLKIFATALLQDFTSPATIYAGKCRREYNRHDHPT